MKPILIITFLIMWICSANAQFYEEILMDSLQRKVDNPITKEADRIAPLIRLSQLYMPRGDSATATNLLSRARMLAMREKDSKYMGYVYNQELMNCLNAYPRNIMRVYAIIDSISTAITHTADNEAQARGYQIIAYAKIATDSRYDFDETYKAIAIAEKLPDKTTEKYKILFGLYESLYVPNRRKENKTETEKYLHLMRQAAEKSGEKDFICWALCKQGENTATFYTNAKDIKDIVSQNFTELENFMSENSKFISSYNYGVAVVNLLQLYLLSPNPQYKYLIDKHIEQYKKAMINNAKNRKVFFTIESLYAKSKQDYPEAIIQFQNLIELYEKEQDKGVWVAYQNQADVYTKINKYKEGYEALGQSFEAYKEYVNARTEEQREVSEVNFSVAQQQQEIEHQRNRYMIITLSAILLIILLIIIVLLLNRQKKIITLEREKVKVIAQQAIEEKERLGKKLIVNTTELNRKVHLIEKVKDMDKEELGKAIQIEQKKSKLTSDYTELFNEINSKFYKLLQTKAAPNDLSNTDLKYCTYISLRMSNKEMAHLMNVEYRTVISQKYRLKKKLHLSENEDLEAFITELISSP